MAVKGMVNGYPCRPFFVWEMATESDIIQFVRQSSQKIVDTLRNWQCSEAVFRAPDAKPIRMPIEVLEEMQPSAKLFYAHVALPPAVIRATIDMIDSPRRVGISRASDGLQVVMSSECQVLNPGHTMTEATAWTRDKFWHPLDLTEFNRDARQRLSLDGSNHIEFKWRSFDPDLGPHCGIPGNWLEFATRYSLINGEDGEVYQLCESLGLPKEILPPNDLASLSK